MKNLWPGLKWLLWSSILIAVGFVGRREVVRCVGEAPACCRAVAVTLFVVIPLTFLVVLWYIRTPRFRARQEGLREYGMAYHAYLVGHYHELLRPRPTAAGPVIEAEKDRDPKIASIVKETDPSKLSWHDLFRLELWIQDRLPDQELERKAWLVRRRYEVVSGEETLHAYEGSKPPEIPPPGADTTALRADLGFVLQDLYWMYEVRTAWGIGRDRISRGIGWLLIVITLALGTIAIARAGTCATLPGGAGLLLIYEAVLMGATGGLVSLWRRLQTAPAADRRLDGVIEFEHGSLTIMFQSFISGAIFAFVLLLIFASGLADGALFPGFKPPEAQVDKSLLCMLATASTNGTAVAKLLVWCFIAGFAERFVPDFLDRLTKSAESSASPAQTSKVNTATPPSGSSTPPSPPTTPSGPGKSPSPN